MVTAVSVSTCNGEVRGSNSVQITKYLRWGVSCYTSISSGKFRGGTVDKVIVASFQILSNSFFIDNSIIRRYYEMLTAS